MTPTARPDHNSTRQSLSLTVLRSSQERIRTTKSLVNDMLRWPDLHNIETPHLRAAFEALEKAERELSYLN